MNEPRETGPAELDELLRAARSDGPSEALLASVRDGVATQAAHAASKVALAKWLAKWLLGVVTVGTVAAGVWTITRDHDPDAARPAPTRAITPANTPRIADDAIDARNDAEATTADSSSSEGAISDDRSSTARATVPSEAEVAPNGAPRRGRARRAAGRRPARPSNSESRATVDRTSPDEVTLLQTARRQVDHAPREALETLAEHRRRFPHGVLAPEREVVEILALARVAPERARARASAFLRRHPNSVHRERVLGAIAHSRQESPR